MKKIVRTATSLALAGGLALAGAGVSTADELTNEQVRQQYKEQYAHHLYTYFYA